MFDVMFMRQKPRDSFESRHTEHLSARSTVQAAARRELAREDVFTRSREHQAGVNRTVRHDSIRYRFSYPAIRYE